jgi:hypothetical protein
MMSKHTSARIYLALMVLLAIAPLSQAASLGTIEGGPAGMGPGFMGDTLLYSRDVFGLYLNSGPLNVYFGSQKVNLNAGTATGGAVDIYNLGTPAAGYNSFTGWSASPIPLNSATGTFNTTDDLSTHSPDNPILFGFVPTPMGASRADALGKLFYQYEEAARSDYDIGAAFQLAIYEILYEDSGTYNVHSGNMFLITRQDVDPFLANTMLASLATATDIAGLYMLNSTTPGINDIIISDGAHLEAATVPEPITMASLGLCILGAGGYLRRRIKE